MTGFLHEAAGWLWDYYLLASVLLLIALASYKLIRQPAQRIALHWATASGLLILALLSAIPGWSFWHMLTAPDQQSPEWLGDAQIQPFSVVQRLEVPQQPAPELSLGLAGLLTEPVTTVPASEIVLIDYGLLSLYVFLVGAVIGICWLSLGAWQVRSLRSQAKPASSELKAVFEQMTAGDQTPALGVISKLSAAVAIGLRRPMILLPDSYLQAGNHEKLQSVLAHELAHIRNRDLWLLALLRGLLPILWLHPLYWLWRRWLRLDQETLADAAATQDTDRADYAEQLVAWARVAAQSPLPRLASSVGLWESPSQLKRRIAILLNEKFTVLRSCSRKWRITCSALIAALALTLSVMTFQPDLVADESDSKAISQDATISEAIEILRTPQLVDPVEKWGISVQSLVEIGSPAVPPLIAALDQETHDHPIRKLAFTLRAIGDKRAIPALIRAIPRTLQPPSSDYGLRVQDPKLAEFLKQYDTENDGEFLTYGRALNEVFRTLHKLSEGKSFGEMELIFVHRQGSSKQQHIQRELFNNVARKWSDWWKKEWQNYVKDNNFSKVDLKPINSVKEVVANPTEIHFPVGNDVRLLSATSGVIVSPSQLRGRDSLLDLDTNRQGSLPLQFSAVNGKDTTAELPLSAWMRAEGLDLIGYVDGTDEGTLMYGVKFLDMRMWQLTENVF